MSAEIIDLRPCPVKVGDCVRWRYGPMAIVFAIAGQKARVAWANGDGGVGKSSFPCSELRIVAEAR